MYVQEPAEPAKTHRSAAAVERATIGHERWASEPSCLRGRIAVTSTGMGRDPAQTPIQSYLIK